MDTDPDILLGDSMGPGHQLGRWVVQDRLGAGGHATVWRAHDAQGTQAAIKVLAPHAVRTDDRERFVREQRALSTIDHPHVVRVLDSGTTDGLLWTALELVDGNDLEVSLERWREHPEPNRFAIAERVFRELGSALQHIHSLGLVHRDVKPANVLLTEDGHVKLSDFGVVTDPDVSRITIAGTLVGTIAYMAPELISEDPFDHRADLYGLGATLYAMLTLRRPIEADTVAGYLARHLTARPVPPHEIDADVPRHLERVAMALLEKDPSRRPATAASAVAALDDDAEEMPPLYGRDDLLDLWRALLHTHRQQGRGALLLVGGPEGSGRHTVLRRLAAVARESRHDVSDDGTVLVETDPYDPSRRQVIDAALARQAVVAALGDSAGFTPTTPDVHAVQLGPLPRRALVQLLRDRGLGTAPATALAARLAQTDSALPRAVHEQVDALTRDGWLVPAERGLRATRPTQDFQSADLPVPRHVEAALAGRLTTLDEDARELLEVLAVLGRPAGATLLSRTASRPARVPASLDAVVRDGWVRVDASEGDAVLSFVHPCGADVVRRQADATTLRSRHLAIAANLGGRRRRRANLEAALHLAAGGLVHEAIEAYLGGTRAALDAGRFDEAARTSADALGLLDSQSVDDPDSQRMLLGVHGAALLGLGRWPEAVPALERALSLARSIGRPEGIGRAAGDLGRALYRLGRLERAAEVLEESLAAHLEDPATTAAARRALADIHLQRGRLDVAITIFRDALAEARGRGSRDEEARARRGIAHVLAMEGRLGEAASEFDAADELLTPNGDPRVRAGVLLRMIELDTAAGRYAYALHRVDLLLDLVEAHSLGHRLPEALASGAELRRLVGQTDEAASLARRAVLLARGHLDVAWPGLLQGARVLRLLGRVQPDEVEVLRQADGLSPGVRRPSTQALTLTARIIAASEPDAARALLARAAADPPALWGLSELSRRLDEGYTHIILGDRRTARTILRGVAATALPDRAMGLHLEVALALSAAGTQLDRASAIDLVSAIAAPLPERMRTGFLSRPEVASLVQGTG